jgi:cytochrome c-type biogenesis protein
MQGIEIGGVFIAGALSFFSPCILPVIPVFISTLLKSAGGQGKALSLGRLKIYLKPLGNVALFVLGLSISFMILGFAFGALGRVINSRVFLTVCGVIVILLGIYQTGLVKIPLLMREKKLEAKRGSGLISSFVLGFTFSFGWTPCVGPILASVLALTASRGGALTGTLYMAVYSLGLLVPFLVFTAFSQLLTSRIKGIYKYLGVIKIVGGIIIIIMGVFLLTDSLYLFSSIAQ